jgi:transcriptional regulator with XRE-family HTH domain
MSENGISKLKAEMLRQGISVARLAALTGVDPRQINRYRSAEVTPRDYYGDVSRNGRRIARALGVDAETLFPVPDRTTK